MITFAHRGARAYARENTLEAFQLALRLGAQGLESDVWLTKDQIPVLDHDGRVGSRLRSRPISEEMRGRLPSHIPALSDLLSTVPLDIPLSLDLKDADSFASVREVYQMHRVDAENLLYLCHPRESLLATWRSQWPTVQLVHSVRLSNMKDGPEKHAALLREVGINAVNMPYSDWTGGLVALFSRFEVGCFAWDCQHERQIREVMRMGVDAVYSDWPDRLADAIR